MKVVTTVKNGWAAQSKNIQPQMPRRLVFAGASSTSVTAIFPPDQPVLSVVLHRPAMRKITEEAGRDGDLRKRQLAAFAQGHQFGTNAVHPHPVAADPGFQRLLLLRMGRQRGDDDIAAGRGELLQAAGERQALVM